VPLLIELAGTGPVLELGIGTGRVALPLRATGVEVHGIDASEAMPERLRAKAGGREVAVTVGNFADVAAPAGPYTLVFVVFNTFFGLLTQHDQVRCFANVARVLAEGGRFLTETFLPDVARFDRGQRTSTVKVSLDEVHLDTNVHDVVAQTVSGQHIVLRTGEPVQMFPVHLRYAYPSELDLMAQLAGFELEARYDGWDHAPLTGPSPSVVSVWRASTRSE
jgi:SAM-dependent methyltransferase